MALRDLRKYKTKEDKVKVTQELYKIAIKRYKAYQRSINPLAKEFGRRAFEQFESTFLLDGKAKVPTLKELRQQSYENLQITSGKLLKWLSQKTSSTTGAIARGKKALQGLGLLKKYERARGVAKSTIVSEASFISEQVQSLEEDSRLFESNIPQAINELHNEGVERPTHADIIEKAKEIYLTKQNEEYEAEGIFEDENEYF